MKLLDLHRPMIKFFRHVRETLISENKMGKYFKYAIGEILLVMIGILLALQVNNWNEQRKINNDIEQLFSSFELELKKNISESSSFLRYGYRVDSVHQLFNSNLVTEKMMYEAPNLLAFSSFGTRTIDFPEDRLIEIIDSEKQIPLKYQRLIPQLKLLKDRIESQKFWESISIDLSMKRREEYVNTYSWAFRNDSISMKKALKFILTDTIHQNKISQYYNIQLQENVWDATLIRSSSVALLWYLQNIKRPNEINNIESFLKTLNLKPFKELTCDEPLKQSTVSASFRRNFVLYNNSQDTISYTIYGSDNELFRSMKVPPKKFRLAEFSISSEEYLKIVRNDTCQKVFQQNKGDYLILE